jgi:parallel beta-helix repeat protein
MTSVLADTIPGIRVVKAFAQERREVERFRRSNDNVLVANDASENRVDGIYLEASERNAFTANHADGNGTYGFEIFAANANVFRGNTASGNTDNGFTLDNGASDNVLKGNRALANGEQGILVFNGTGNVLQKNTVDENGENGILGEVGTLTLRGNRANRNGFVDGGEGDDAGLGISVPAGAVSAANQATGNDDPNECESAEVDCHVP